MSVPGHPAHLVVPGGARGAAVRLVREILDVSLFASAIWLGAGLAMPGIPLVPAVASAIVLQLLGVRVLQPTALDKPFAFGLIALLAAWIVARPEGASLAADGIWRLGGAIVLTGAIGDVPRAWRLAKAFVFAAGVRCIFDITTIAIGFRAPPVVFRPATFLAAAALMMLAAALVSGAFRGRRAGLAAFLAVPLGVGALTTFLRTAWLALAVSVAAVAIVGRRVKQVGVMLLLLVGPLIIARSSPVIQERAERALARERAHLGAVWARAVEQLAAHPVAGIGPGTFLTRTKGDFAARRIPPQSDANSSFLSAWLQSGPLGLLGAIWLFGAGFAALRRGYKSLAPEEIEARSLVLAGSGAAGLLLAWSLTEHPLADGRIAHAVSFLIALGFAAAGEAGRPAPDESLFPVPTPLESLEPARNSAATAAVALAGAALGGTTALGAVGPSFGLACAALLGVLGILHLPMLQGHLPVTLRGLVTFVGAALLACMPFAIVVQPGSVEWWQTPGAVTAVCAVVCGLAGTTHAIRRPGRVGPAPVAGALAAVWAIAFPALLEWGLIGSARGYDPGGPFSYNFAVAAAAVCLLFLGWTGPLGFGVAPVEGTARRLLHLPAAAVALGLAAAAYSGLK